MKFPKIFSAVLVLSVLPGGVVANVVIQSVTYPAESSTVVSDPVNLSAGSNVTVSSGAYVEYAAGSQIILGPGFNATEGSVLWARIDSSLVGSPTNVTPSSISESSFVLSWSPAPAPSGISGYEVQLGAGALQWTTNLSYTFNGLNPATGYLAKVRAVSNSGTESGWAIIGVATTPPPIPGGGGGLPGASANIWYDVDGDGIKDEIVKHEGEFYYWADVLYTTSINYHQTNYDINLHWEPQDINFENTLRPNFTFYWWDTPQFWIGYTADIQLTFGCWAPANQPYKIFRDPTGSTSFDPEVWEELINFPGLSVQGMSFLSHVLVDPDELPNATYYMVRKGLPIGDLQISDSSGNNIVAATASDGTAEVILPPNEEISLSAFNVGVNAIASGSAGLEWRILDSIGNVIFDWMPAAKFLFPGVDHDNLQVQARLSPTLLAFITVGIRKIILEPITVTGGFPPHNPGGLEVGAQGIFKISLNAMSGVSNDDIVWTATGQISIVGSNKGKQVTVVGNGVGAGALEVQVGNYAGPKPTVATYVRQKDVINLKIMVVRNPENNKAAATQSEITALIDRSNLIFRQAAIEFVQAGGITYIEDKDFLHIRRTNGEEPLWKHAKDLTGKYHKGNFPGAGLEVYFVTSMGDSADIAGLYVSNVGNEAGIIIAMKHKDVINRLAHELGHAFYWEDIYLNLEPHAPIPSTRVSESWLPLDWNNGPGPAYYPTSLRHRDLVQYRLLMHGKYRENDAIAIPRGTVWGLSKLGVPGPRNVGQWNMFRTPDHP